MNYEIKEPELMEILKSYSLSGLFFDKFIQVEPDTALYILHDNKNIRYVLVVADYLGGYEETELPCEFEYDYYSDRVVVFHAVHRFSYVDNAPKMAKGCIDDCYLWTKASTGDVCMLFACDEVKINGVDL